MIRSGERSPCGAPVRPSTSSAISRSAADQHAQHIGVGGLLQKRAQRHHVLGHRGSFRFAPRSPAVGARHSRSTDSRRGRRRRVLPRGAETRRRGHGKPAVVGSLNSTAFGMMTGVRARSCGWSDESRKSAGLGGPSQDQTAQVGKTGINDYLRAAAASRRKAGSDVSLGTLDSIRSSAVLRSLGTNAFCESPTVKSSNCRRA